MKTVEKSNNLDLIVSDKSIESRIFIIRDRKAILDTDLALLYGETVKRLKQQVNRNIDRFPNDFMFTLSWEEVDSLRLQNATLYSSMRGRHIKYPPYAFTEEGISMLSSVLRSKRAILVNIAIMRAFVKLRQMISINKELAQKIAELEHKIGQHDQDIISLFNAINQMLRYEDKPKGKIGFI